MHTESPIDQAEKLLYGVRLCEWKAFGSREVGARQLTLHCEAHERNGWLAALRTYLRAMPWGEQAILTTPDLTHITVSVNEELFRGEILPRLQEMPKRVPSMRIMGELSENPLMACRIRGLLFDRGWQAWEPHTSELYGNAYARVFSEKDLRVRDRQYALSDILPYARELMRETTGIATLGAYRNPQLGHVYFTVPPEDFQRLQSLLQPKGPGTLDNGIRHLRFAERYRSPDLAQQRQGTVAEQRSR